MIMILASLVGIEGETGGGGKRRGERGKGENLQLGKEREGE